jgi:hypothetical protein
VWRWLGIWLAGSALLLVWSWILSGWSGLWLLMVYAALIGILILGFAALVFSQPWFRIGTALYGLVWLALAGYLAREAWNWKSPGRIFGYLTGIEQPADVKVIAAHAFPGIGGYDAGWVLFRAGPEARSNLITRLRLVTHETMDGVPEEELPFRLLASNRVASAGVRYLRTTERMTNPFIYQCLDPTNRPLRDIHIHFDRASDLGFVGSY